MDCLESDVVHSTPYRDYSDVIAARLAELQSAGRWFESSIRSHLKALRNQGFLL